MEGIIIKVYGKVQGVFYRKSTLEVAKKLGLRGYVQNLPDGSVLVNAEGSRESLEDLTKWCKKGPSSARVDQIEHEKTELAGYDDFVIRM